MITGQHAKKHSHHYAAELTKVLFHHIHLAPWKIVVGVSFCAGIGSGWSALIQQTQTPSPLWAAISMMLAIFTGWYAWAFFTHLVDVALFQGYLDYQETHHNFCKAYLFQALGFFAFIHPGGWLWTWIAAYLTIVAWGFIASRQFGVRTYQPIIAATIGLLMWLSCLWLLVLLLTWDGLYIGIGSFLV